MTDVAPISVGVLDDISAAGDTGYQRLIEAGLAAELARTPIDRPVELEWRGVTGLPRGTVHAVRQSYAELRDRGVVAVLGPTITDNVLAIKDLADAAALPTLAWPGGEECRSEYVFHYQAGSLEDEPPLLAGYLARLGLTNVALVHDSAATGNRLAECFRRAASRNGMRIVSTLAVPAIGAPLPDGYFDELSTASPDALVHLGLFGIRALADGLRARSIEMPVVSNIVASMAQNNPEWLEPLEGWVYVDMVSDGNLQLEALRPRLPEGSPRGPRLVAGLDVGRLLGQALANAPVFAPSGVRDGLETVKQMPACAGKDGTMMGFGHWDRGALKGEFLVLRRYVDGVSVECHT